MKKQHHVKEITRAQDSTGLLPLTSCMTLNKFLHVIKPLFPHLFNGKHNFYLRGLLLILK